jgi:hypothetical protein
MREVPRETRRTWISPGVVLVEDVVVPRLISREREREVRGRERLVREAIERERNARRSTVEMVERWAEEERRKG